MPKLDIPVEDSVTYIDVNFAVIGTYRNTLVYQVNAVENAILHIIGTPRRQRLMRPTFGSFVHQILFDPLDTVTATKLEMEIYAAVAQWESERVNLPRTGITVAVDKLNGVFQVALRYKLLRLNDLQVHHNFRLKSLFRLGSV